MRLTFVLGPALLAVTLLLPPPAGLSPAAWAAAGLALLMGLWWLTEPVPLAVTALLPLAVAPLAGLATPDAVARAYGDPLIFLFLGGFVLALAIERWGLHRRIALSLMRLAGDSPGAVLAAVMGATAFLSLWISNTAAAMVMAPIAAGIGAGAERRQAVALLLGVAFSASIGGMGSLIGTPPNAVFAAYMSNAHGIEIGFARWAMVGVPVALALLAVCWLVLALVTPGMGRARFASAEAAAPGPMKQAEARVALVAALTAAAWIGRPALVALFPGLGLTDAGIAVMAVLALFLIPSGQGGRLLDWESVAGLRWDVLILFGGGLALAGILESSGLAAWLGAGFAALGAVPVPVLVVAMAVTIVVLGELASNTAMAAIFLPIAGAAAVSLGADVMAVLVPVALATSLGFMLPVATPPNAIVFSLGSVRRADMLRAGAILDVAGIAVVLVIGGLAARLLS